LNNARHTSPSSTPISSRVDTEFVNDDRNYSLSPTGEYALDDAENPLQLLVRASNLRRSKSEASDINASSPRTVNPENELDSFSDLHKFFLPMRASIDGYGREDDHESDPIYLGLVTEEEANMLLS
jgi:hypothetical protein